MVENKGFDILDYLFLIVKWKKLLVVLFILSLITSYLIIYYAVPEVYESTAIVLPLSDSQVSGISSLMKNLNNLPLGLGGKSKNGEGDIYLTVIYSRTCLENLVRKFNLIQDYKVKLMDEAVKMLRRNLIAEMAEDNSFHISIRAGSPQKAAEMVNYVLQYLNDSVIKLNVAKSKNNREFLEKRYQEIKQNLKFAEDSLQLFQQKSGILDAKEQPKLILNSFSKLENDVMAKQIELSIMEKIVSKGSPQLEPLKAQLKEYQSAFNKLKSKGDDQNLIQPLGVIPEKTKNYIRYFRNVEIYNSILEFIIPLYEQAKFEEQKDMPVLQVIDYGNIPQKRIYPQRTILSIIISVVILIFVIAVIILREVFSRSTNPKIDLIKQELRLFNKQKQNYIGNN